jgi:putative ubiquitin-RnfH superfamily antitoxin RatB of RatAB toxin-antitoxin module
MKIEIVHATPAEQGIIVIDLPPGTSVGEALAVAQSRGLLSKGQGAHAALARFGQTASAQDILREGDRIELLRPLVADPKESRRRRAEVQSRRKKTG